MAKNDVELSVGVRLDETGFINGYENMLSKASADTQARVQGAIESFKGPATKNWDELPYSSMHDKALGQRAAARTFVASMSEDLRAQHVSSKSAEYQNALIGAAYRAAEADPTKRYHRMLAEGHYAAADANYPTTALAKAIDTNYALMEQDWSRDFIKKRKGKGFDAEELKKLTKAELFEKAEMFGLSLPQRTKKDDIISKLVFASEQPQAYIDFAGMRDFAVRNGFGRWKEEALGNTADNFELIDKELEKIDKKSEKTKKHFTGWGDSLKGVLGTLTAIAAIGIKSFEVAYKASEAGTIAAANEVDKRRGFLGMSSYDVLRTKVAGVSVGLGENAIYDEILGMSNKVERFKLEGKGDVLPESIMGIFGTLINASDPYGAYTKAIDQIYTQAKGMNTDERRRLLMLMSDAGLGSASSLIGAFLSNPDFAAQYGTPSQLFSLTDNPYYGVHDNAELLAPQIVKLNESLKASYEQMAKDWETAFGVPFKTWWDNVLKNTIVPWFERFLGLIPEDQEVAEGAITNIYWDLVNNSGKRNEAIESHSGSLYIAPQKVKGGLAVSAWTDWSKGDMNYQGDAATAQWNQWNDIAKTKDKELSKLDPVTRAAAEGVRSRVQYMVDRLKDTGLAAFLKDNNKDDMDIYLNRVIQRGAYDTSENWQKTFDDYIDKVLAVGARFSTTDDEAIAVLRQIADNTGANKYLTGANAAEFWLALENVWDKATVASIRSMVETNAGRE